ncbi:MAG: hypothetical protein ACR2M7_01805 [Bdellovibrionales bacterium]
MNLPARTAPDMAAKLGVDEHLLVTELERAVRRHLEERAADVKGNGVL